MRKLLWAIESTFERDEPELLKRLQNESGPEASLPIEMLLAFQERNYSLVVTHAEKLLGQATNPALFGFTIQFAVAATEIIYNMSLRNVWLSRWGDNSKCIEDDYCRFLQLYHLALTNFFSGRIGEAEGLFQQALNISRAIDYQRGEMRTLYHLALIAKESGKLNLAEDRFSAARTLAERNGANRLLRLISPATNEPEILEALILDRKWAEARRLYLKLERIRRREGKHRGAESLYAYQAILCLAYNKQNSFSLIKRKTEDPLVLEKILQFKQKLFSFTAHEVAELDFVRLVIGKASPEGIEKIAGINLLSLPKKEIANFMRLLVQSSQPVPKESICKALWNFNYDPAVHDGRLYKLVHHTRRAFQKSDIIINDYGSYRINPTYRNLSN